MNLVVADLCENFAPSAFEGKVVWADGNKTIVCRRDDNNCRHFKVFNEFGFSVNAAGKKVPVVAEVTVDADKRYGSKSFEVEINWAAWGAQPVATAEAFTETMSLAIEFAKVLEAWCEYDTEMNES